jgi:hypothetical protein
MSSPWKNLFRLGAPSLALLSALTGCSGGNSPAPSPSSPPSPSPSSSSTFSVTSVQPASGATQVAATSAVQIVFSSSADSSTVNTTNITLAGPSAVAGSVAYDSSNNTATFTPSAALAANTTYTLNVSGVTSAGGTALSSTFKSTFTTASIQYQAMLFSNVVASSGNGQVTVDTGGNVTVNLTGATPSTDYTVNFCTNVTSPACLNVGTVSSDASGNGSLTTMFPQSGDWAGNFELQSGGTTVYYTALYSTTNATTVTTSMFSATLLPYTKTDDGAMLNAGTLQQDPLTGGSVTYANGKFQITLKGALPDAYYEFIQDFVPLNSPECSECYEIGGFETDASGDYSGPSSTKSTADTSGDIFLVENGPYAGFIGGFSVPQQ